MASSNPGGDTAVGDVSMTERDQPATSSLEQTKSGLKRLHDGEVKAPDAASSGGGGGGDTACAADQLLAVLEAGVKAAAGGEAASRKKQPLPTGGGGGGGDAESMLLSGPNAEINPPSLGGDESTAADTTAADVASSGLGTKPDATAAGQAVVVVEGGVADKSVEPANPTAVAPYASGDVADTEEATEPVGGGGGGEAQPSGASDGGGAGDADRGREEGVAQP